jgi:hypothetical protein
MGVSIVRGNTLPPAIPSISTWSQGWAFDFTASDPAGTWRFEATYNGQVYETFFNVNAPPLITVGSPNGGEQWDRKLTHSVTWTDNLGGDVNIALYHNGVYSATIASNTPSDGGYVWTPDTSLATGPGYTIRVISVINPAVYDVGDAPFTLTDPQLLARNDLVLTPINTSVTIDILGNDEIPVGEPITITAGLPFSGTVSLIDTHLVYTPTLDFLGTDVLTYTLRTSTEQANATVTVIVAAEVYHSFLPLIQR